jgi:hypothetical protein
MRLQRALVMVFVLAVVVPVEPAPAIDCQKFAVTAADGYANVRSTLHVKVDNVVAALASGMSIEVIKQAKGWFQISFPVQGWIAGTQISRYPCDSAVGVSSTAGLAAIDRLGKQAASSDQKSAATFLKLSRGVDGSLADAYAEAITEWAGRDASLLLARLNAQPPAVRQAALRLLAVGFGVGQSRERHLFEATLQQSPSAQPIVREWRRIISP